MLLWFIFGVSDIVPKVLKMLVFFFPVFWGFCGVAYSCLFGFGRFRSFRVSCVCFSFLCCFVSVLFALFLFCCWVLVLVLFFCFFCVVFVFLFLFFGGFKGQVRWPFGPPHLAQNPPYFYLFLFLFVFFSFCVL